jgi:hypothetical protein
MNRPSKKEIKAAVDALKEGPKHTGGSSGPNTGAAKEAAKKSNQRIRKQGV